MTRFLISLTYLSIKNDRKELIDWVLPLISGGVVFFLTVNLNNWGLYFGEKGVLMQLNGFVGIVIGFFVASLAAVAALPRSGDSLDMPMPGKPLLLTKKSGRVSEEISLSRRQFLSLLFGHLAMTAIFLFGFGLVGIIVYALDISVYQPLAWIPVNAIFASLYTFVFGHILVGLSLGVYYLADRIHYS
jgi:hypothetical protein